MLQDAIWPVDFLCAVPLGHAVRGRAVVKDSFRAGGVEYVGLLAGHQVPQLVHGSSASVAPRWFYVGFAAVAMRTGQAWRNRYRVVSLM